MEFKVSKIKLRKLEKEFADYDISYLCNECENKLSRYSNGKWIHRVGGYRQLCSDTLFGLKKDYLKSQKLADLKTEYPKKYWGHLKTIYFIRKELKLTI